MQSKFNNNFLLRTPERHGNYGIAFARAGDAIFSFEAEPFELFGFACVAVSSYYLSTFPADVDLYDVSRASFDNGLGIGFIWVPLTVNSFETLPPRHRTEASTLTSLAGPRRMAVA